jgi:hypothetical protein
MTKTKNTPAPLTRGETLELLEKAMRKPGIKPATLLKLEAAHSKLLGKQPIPSPAPSHVLWKPEDLFIIEPDDTPERIADKEAANAIIQADGFWSIAPDGRRWGPEQRQQERTFGEEWQETVYALEKVQRTSASVRSN